MDGELRLCEAVMRELPLARDFDEPSSMEVSKVPRDARLREGEDLDKVADAELTGDEQIQDANPGGVRKASEEQIEIGDRVGGGHL